MPQSLPQVSLPISMLLVDKTADSKEEYQYGDYASPGVDLARSGGNGVVLGNEALTC